MRYAVYGLTLAVSCGLLLADGVEAARRSPSAYKKLQATKQSKLRRAKSYMSVKDKNKDGKLNRRELGLKPELFSKADKNRDGFVSLGELVMLPGFQTKSKLGLDGKGDNGARTFFKVEVEGQNMDKCNMIPGKMGDLMGDIGGTVFEPGFFCKPVPACNVR